jgi:hypothetical protein
LEPGQLGDDIGREQVGAGRQHLAELDEHAACLFQRDPEIPGERARLIGAGPPSGQVGAQPVAGGDASDLQVPPAPVGALAQRPDRMGDPGGPQPSFHRGEPARAGEQFEHDSDQHRGDERPEQHDRPRQRLRAAALAVDRPGGSPAQDQAGEPGQDRAPPAHPDPEQAAADPGQDHHGDQGEQPAEHRDTPQEADARSAKPHSRSPRFTALAPHPRCR